MSDNKIDDGGPAFPRAIHDSYDRVNDLVCPENGMTLRDYFAAAALDKASRGGSRTSDEIAARAYFIADAMIRQRSKR